MSDPSTDSRQDDAERVFVGRFGWSNVRIGLEFYEPDPPNGKGARWEPRRREPNGPTGLLLQDQIEATLGHAEGAAVVVVVLPGRLKMADAEAFAEKARDLLREARS